MARARAYWDVKPWTRSEMCLLSCSCARFFRIWSFFSIDIVLFGCYHGPAWQYRGSCYLSRTPQDWTPEHERFLQ